MIPETFISELKSYCDIEQILSSYLTLTRRGRLLTGLCPFHNEKTPSFTVYTDSQSYYCFGCGAGGDVVTFIRQIENLDYIEAIRLLAGKAGLTVPESGEDKGVAAQKLRILELNRLAARFFHQQLSAPVGREVLHYLRDRGLTDDTIRRFGVGFAPESWDALAGHLKGAGYSEADIIAARLATGGKSGDRCLDLFRDRVMFPIIDLRGSVIAFGGRRLHENGPKYLNSSDTPVFKKSRNLFALNRAKSSQRQGLILAEGYMDVIALHQGGFDNAVATLGTSLTAEQAGLIAKYSTQVVIAYDSDEAGQTATRRAMRLFSDTGVRVRVLRMQGAKDPDEYIKKFGAKRLQLLLDQSAGAVEFEIMRLQSLYDVNQSEDKVRFLGEFADLMATLPNPIERDVYMKRIASELSVSGEALLAEVMRRQKNKGRTAQRRQQRDLKSYVGARDRESDPQRMRNLKSAIAQERLITVLMKNPDYLPHIRERITQEMFSVDFNRGVYLRLTERIDACLPVDLMSLSGVLEMPEMAFLSGLLAGQIAQRHSLPETDDYITTIVEEYHQKTGTEVAAMGEEELSDYLGKMAAAKKNRGK